MSIEHRYVRNLGMLGKTGQARIESARVMVVGLGGLGSHLVQQLAYLGVRRYTLIDSDIVELSNLNRLVTAYPGDEGRRKVDVAERLLRMVQPSAEVRVHATPLGEAPTETELASTDCVFGCLDNDAARLLLTERTSNAGVPYFDLASDTDQSGERLVFGGRVFASLDGLRCLSCAGELDQRALAAASMSPEQKEADARIYGVDTEQLGDSGPMVVSVNGVVASLAVTEFMAWRAGIREPRPHLVYRADVGTVTVRNEASGETCYYCGLWRAAGTTIE